MIGIDGIVLDIPLYGLLVVMLKLMWTMNQRLSRVEGKLGCRGGG